MPTTKLLLATGDHLEVRGPMEDVAKKLENAARSGSGTLAWLTDAGADEPLGVNPARVVTVAQGDD